MLDFCNLMWEGKLKNFQKILFLSRGTRAFGRKFAEFLPILTHTKTQDSRPKTQDPIRKRKARFSRGKPHLKTERIFVTGEAYFLENPAYVV